jgi:hypothetical protein
VSSVPWLARGCADGNESHLEAPDSHGAVSAAVSAPVHPQLACLTSKRDAPIEQLDQLLARRVAALQGQYQALVREV